MAKVLVIGLDGMDWILIEKLIKEGDLPTIKKLIADGASGDLESVIPPGTGSAWSSFATGKNPGNHGCFEFVLPQNSLNDHKVIDTTNIDGETFYEILDKHNKRCIIINLPVSYPNRIDSIIIPDWSAICDDKIIPHDLEKELPEIEDYRAFPDISLLTGNKLRDYIQDVSNVERKRFDVAKRLFEKEWDFFFILFSGTDFIQHRLYDELTSGKQKIRSITNLYKEIDDYIGWFLDNSTPETTLIIMSDHGFDSYEGAFHTDSWLREKGYLEIERSPEPKAKIKWDEETAKADHRSGIELPTFLLTKFGDSKMVRSMYNKVTKFLPIKVKTDFQPKLSETIAYGGPAAGCNYGFIYINRKSRFKDGMVRDEEYERTRTDIMKRLALIKDMEGKKAMRNIWKGEEIYQGKCLKDAPDIVFGLHRYRVVANAFFLPVFANKSVTGTGCNAHSLMGIFIAHGGDINNGVKIKDTHIIDLAPTILHILDVPLPRNLDGKVLKNIFKVESESAKRKLNYESLPSEKVKIKEGIEKLKIKKSF